MGYQVKVISGSPKVEVMGLGVLETNTWVDVDDLEAAAFEAVHGRTLSEAHIEGRFEVKGAIALDVIAPVEEEQETPDDGDEEPEGGDE